MLSTDQHLDDLDVGTVQPELSSVLTIPSESEERVVAHEVWRQDHLVTEDRTVILVRVAASNTLGHATPRVLWSTGEPGGVGCLAAPASADAVRMHWLGFGWLQDAVLEALLEVRHLAIGRRVALVSELCDEGLVLAHTIRVHATVVRYIRHAPARSWSD